MRLKAPLNSLLLFLAQKRFCLGETTETPGSTLGSPIETTKSQSTTSASQLTTINASVATSTTDVDTSVMGSTGEWSSMPDATGSTTESSGSTTENIGSYLCPGMPKTQKMHMTHPLMNLIFTNAVFNEVNVHDEKKPFRVLSPSSCWAECTVLDGCQSWFVLGARIQGAVSEWICYLLRHGLPFGSEEDAAVLGVEAVGGKPNLEFTACATPPEEQCLSAAFCEDLNSLGSIFHTPEITQRDDMHRLVAYFDLGCRTGDEMVEQPKAGCMFDQLRCCRLGVSGMFSHSKYAYWGVDFDANRLIKHNPTEIVTMPIESNLTIDQAVSDCRQLCIDTEGCKFFQDRILNNRSGNHLVALRAQCHIWGVVHMDPSSTITQQELINDLASTMYSMESIYAEPPLVWVADIVGLPMEVASSGPTFMTQGKMLASSTSTPAVTTIEHPTKDNVETEMTTTTIMSTTELGTTTTAATTTTTTTTTSTTSTTTTPEPCDFQDVDFFGYDVGTVNGVFSLQACRERCQQNAICRFFSFVNDTCYLKWSDYGRAETPGVQSGLRNCPVGSGDTVDAEFMTRVYPNTDAMGADIEKAFNVPNVATCANLCRLHPICEIWTLTAYALTCYLKGMYRGEEPEFKPVFESEATISGYKMAESPSGGDRLDQDCYEFGIDFQEGNLNAEYGAWSLHRCQELCQLHEACRYYVYDKNISGCFLKWGFASRKNAQRHIISGKRWCSELGVKPPLCQGKLPDPFCGTYASLIPLKVKPPDATPGVGTSVSDISTWWQKQELPVNWSIPAEWSRIGFSFWSADEDCIISDLVENDTSCWEKAEEFFPSTFDMEVILVIKGSQFTGFGDHPRPDTEIVLIRNKEMKIESWHHGFWFYWINSGFPEGWPTDFTENEFDQGTVYSSYQWVEGVPGQEPKALRIQVCIWGELDDKNPLFEEEADKHREICQPLLVVPPWTW